MGALCCVGRGFGPGWAQIWLCLEWARWAGLGVVRTFTTNIEQIVGKQLVVKWVITPIYPIYYPIYNIGGSNHQPVVKIGVSEGQPNSPLWRCEVLKQDSQTSDPHKV